jgi:hypothetical protein
LCPQQEVKDYRGMLSRALLRNGPDAEALVSAEKEDWKQVAAMHLRGEQQELVKAQTKRKQFRSKTYELSIALESMLQNYGLCLQTFQVLDSAPYQSPWRWPHLTLSADEGPDVVALDNFLQRHLKLNMTRYSDWSHGVHNDIKLAIKGVRKWWHIQAMTIARNHPYGPYGQAMWFKQLQDATKEYFAKAAPSTCPMFEYYFDALLKGRGWQHRRSEEGIEQVLWLELQNAEAFAFKGDKIGLSRWMAYSLGCCRSAGPRVPHQAHWSAAPADHVGQARQALLQHPGCSFGPSSGC